MNQAWKLDISREIIDGVLVITVAGRLGAESSGLLLETVAGAVSEGHRRIVVDLRGVDYISSPGLLMLDAAAGRLHETGGRLVLCALCEPVRLALELSGLLPEFTVVESRTDGIDSLMRG